MPVLLCLAAFPLLFALFWRSAERPDRPDRGWAEAFLLAATAWAALAVLLAEMLGAFQALALAPMATAWVTADAVLLTWAWAVWRRRRARVSFHRPVLSRLDVFFMGILGIYLLALAAVAWAAPPNNVDSLQYHMARVVHWAQQGSLAHYAAGYGPQLWSPPAAEVLILNLRTLAGNDRLANFVQWFAFLSSLVGVWWIGTLFSVGRLARWVAVGFAVSVPMAVLQSTSTQNDMVVAFWLLTLAAFSLKTSRRSLTPIDCLALGLTLGVGLLTKATFYFLCVPFVGWLALSRPWRTDVWRSLRDLAVVALLAAALNLGQTWRHLGIGWTPFGPPGRFPIQPYPASVPRAAATAALRVIQAGMLNFATPSPDLNDQLTQKLARFQATLGISTDRPLLIWDWNHEEVAGSPIHLLIVIVSAACLILQRRWPREALAYAACLTAGFVLLPVTTATAVDPLNIRYQLPTVVAWSPLIGLVVARNLGRRALNLGAVGLLLLALPWLLFNKTRPIIALRPDPGPGELPCLAGCTSIGSIFSVPVADALFANRREHLEEYLGTTNALQAGACREIGLRLESYDPEYALWYLLDAPQSGFHLETIYPSPDMEPLLDREFRPCAIICTVCGGRTRLHGLDLAAQTGGMKLFVGEGFTWDEDG